MLDEDIRALLKGHPATTGDLPVEQVLNVDLLDVAVIGDPIVPASRLGHGTRHPQRVRRHDNDGVFSFYVASPVGHAGEVGHGAWTIGEGWDDSRRHRVSAWGHQPLRRQPTAGPPP
jgi:hypothetical protein